MELKAKMYFGLRNMAKKFKKLGQVENISMNLQNTPTYYLKYRKKESKDKALRELIKEEGVAEVSSDI